MAFPPDHAEQLLVDGHAEPVSILLRGRDAGRAGGLHIELQPRLCAAGPERDLATGEAEHQDVARLAIGGALHLAKASGVPVVDVLVDRHPAELGWPGAAQHLHHPADLPYPLAAENGDLAPA